MVVTRQYCQQIIDYNTVGKGKNNPSFTALVNARRWLCNLNYFGVGELNLPEQSGVLNSLLFKGSD